MNEPAAALEFLGTVELQIPSKPEWVAVARLAISGIANRLPFSVEDIDDLKLATGPAMSAKLSVVKPTNCWNAAAS